MADTFILYHNNRCSKSREALAWLQSTGIPFEIVHYLDTPPTEAQLREIAALLQLSSPIEMMRTKEALFGELNLKNADAGTLFAAMAQHPRLIERPIGIYRNRAAIGRPLDRLQALLED